MIYFLFPLCLFLQNGSLPALIENMNTALSDIETDKEVIHQHWEYNEANPFQVTFIRVTEEVDGDKEEREKYELNLAILDSGNTEIKSSKNEMKIILEMDKGKFIRKYEDGEAKGYDDKLEILCFDIDAARALKDMVNESIDVAKTSWESSIQLPDDLTSLKSWLEEYVSPAHSEKKKYIQSFTASDKWEDYVVLAIGEEDKEDEMKTYELSLSDVDPGKIKVGNAGDLIKVELHSHSNKRTFKSQSEKDGVTFEDELEVYFEDATAALEWAKGLEKAFVPAKEMAAMRHESYLSCNDCLNLLSKLASAYKDEEWKISLDNTCQATLQYFNKDKDEMTSYLFEWGDLDEEKVDMDYDKSALKITLEVKNKMDYITVLEEGEIGDYKNKIELLFQDVESFKEAGGTVAEIISSCELSIKPATIEWLSETIASSSPIDKTEQSLTLAEGEECAVIFTASETDGDKSQSFEFNLFDLDPDKIDMSIKKNKLELELETNNKEKIITVTDHEGKLEYDNKISILFSDIVQLRTSAMTLERMIKGCKE